MWSRGAGGDQRDDGLEVFLGVHADGGLARLEHPDRDAVLEKAKLLELLRLLQRRRRQRVEHLEHRAAVCVHADVLPVYDVAAVVAIAGNGQPGEVERVAVTVRHHLVRGARGDFLRRGADLERGDLDFGLQEEWPHHRLEMARGHERLVALNVDVDVGHARARNFPQAVSPGAMRARRHHRGHVVGMTGFHDLLAVGGDQQIGQHRTAQRPLEDVDHHRHTLDLAQHLAGQTRRMKPSRNHAQDFHSCSALRAERRPPAVARRGLSRFTVRTSPRDAAGKARIRSGTVSCALGCGSRDRSVGYQKACARERVRGRPGRDGRRRARRVQMRGGDRRPHARRSFSTLSVRLREPTKQMGPYRPPAGPEPVPRRRGSRTSRRASPSMLKPKTAKEMAAPGKMAIQGARCMKERPEPASMAPQDGRGGGTPRPRKESEDSARMTPPSPMVATMITVASRFGTTWRSTMRRCGVPMARADSMYGFSITESAAPRITRALEAATRIDRERMRFKSPGPSTAMRERMITK